MKKLTTTYKLLNQFEYDRVGEGSTEYRSVGDKS